MQFPKRTKYGRKLTELDRDMVETYGLDAASFPEIPPLPKQRHVPFRRFLTALGGLGVVTGSMFMSRHTLDNLLSQHLEEARSLANSNYHASEVVSASLRLGVFMQEHNIAVDCPILPEEVQEFMANPVNLAVGKRGETPTIYKETVDSIANLKEGSATPRDQAAVFCGEQHNLTASDEDTYSTLNTELFDAYYAQHKPAPAFDATAESYDEYAIDAALREYGSTPLGQPIETLGLFIGISLVAYSIVGRRT